MVSLAFHASILDAWPWPGHNENGCSADRVAKGSNFNILCQAYRQYPMWPLCQLSN